MAYTKIIFQNSPSTATPLNAQNLNHMDDQIALNDQRLTELETAGVVNTFNGRTGNVVPEKGDYDVSQIGATDGQNGYVPVWRNSGTEESPDWGFNMEPQSGSGTGGHTIVDQNGNAMASEDALQFADSHVTDDSTNGRTVVENIKEVASADYPSETEDGMYLIPDGEGAVIGPASDDKVEVTADGNKTYRQLLLEIWGDSKFDISKITYGATLTIGANVLSLVYLSTTIAKFSAIRDVDNDHEYSVLATLESSYPLYMNVTDTTTSNDSSTLCPQGTVITLYYGNKKATVDLQTTANRCWMADGTNIQQRVGNKNFGTRVDISSSTSSSNKYTCPSDGYVRFEGTGGVSLELNDVTMFQNTNLRTSIYVRKGMTVWFSAGTLSVAEFIPLTQ